MCRQSSDSSSSSEDNSAEKDFGWSTEIQETYSKILKKQDNDLVKIADNNVQLTDLFSEFKIKLDYKQSPSGWDYFGKCPFPDHEDSSPSFYFNQKENRYNCFGCHRGGKASSFYSHMFGISFYKAAYQLISKLQSIHYLPIEANEPDERIDAELERFSTLVRGAIEAGKADLVEKATWPLDVYLDLHIPDSSINFDDLKKILDIIEENLNE